MAQDDAIGLHGHWQSDHLDHQWQRLVHHRGSPVAADLDQLPQGVRKRGPEPRQGDDRRDDDDEERHEVGDDRQKAADLQSCRDHHRQDAQDKWRLESEKTDGHVVLTQRRQNTLPHPNGMATPISIRLMAAAQTLTGDQRAAQDGNPPAE